MSRHGGNQSHIAGVLPVIKEPGPTSHDVVQIARRSLKLKQIGHTGTLDPAAGGLLVLCLGPYTKLVPYLTQCDKTYRGWIGLGLETDTDDGEGVPLFGVDPSGISDEAIRAAAVRFVGEQDQVPPRYAAVKIDGKKLYEYARKGEEVEVPPRPVTVHSFELGAVETIDVTPELKERAAARNLTLPATIRRVEFVARVSAGTYVRSLARDLGRQLGIGGYLFSLWRDSVGSFSIDRAIKTADLIENPSSAEDFMIRGASAVDPVRYPTLTLIQGFMRRHQIGQPLNDLMMVNQKVAAAIPNGATCSLCSEDGALLAMLQAQRVDSVSLPGAYDVRFQVAFRSLRTFPGGLR